MSNAIIKGTFTVGGSCDKRYIAHRDMLWLCPEERLKEITNEGLNPLTLEIGYPRYLILGICPNFWKEYGSVRKVYYDASRIIKRAYY